jgi:hypothetical protein
MNQSSVLPVLHLNMQSNTYFPTDAYYPSIIDHSEAGFGMPSDSVLPLPFPSDSANLLAPLTFDDPEPEWGIPAELLHALPQEYQSNGYSAWASFEMPIPLASASDSLVNQSALDNQLPPQHITSPTQVVLVNDSPPPHLGSATTPFAPIVRRRARKKNRLSKEQRINYLQNDEYVLSFTAMQVFCAGCLQTIKLDDRDGAEYYLGFWLTHQRRCAGIKEGMVSHLNNVLKVLLVNICVRLP